MFYTNITCASTKPAEHYVHKNWVQSGETTFFRKHVLARGTHLFLAPASAITSALDTIIGIGSGIGAICTLGKHKPTLKFALNHLDGSRKIIARPYVNLLKTLNPETELTGNAFSDNPHIRDLQSFVSDKYPLIGSDGDGFITHFAGEAIKNSARTCYNSDSFLKRHIVSRLTYALLAVSCLVTRAVDGLIGIPATGLSILTGGKFESLNNLAYRTLQMPGIINDLFYCTIKFINPWARISKT